MADVYHDRERNLLLYAARDPSVLMQYVSTARAVDGYVAVPITLHNLQICRWLGLPVVPLLNYDYDWPHGPQIVAPFRAQIITSNFLAMHPRAFCLSDPRTGKTMSLLWAADRVMRDYQPGECRAIISAPLGILQDVWGNAIYRHFLGRRTYRVLHGSAAQRIKLLAEPADFYVINHDGLGVGATVDNKGRIVLDGFSKLLAERADIRIAIIDECRAFSAGNTRRHRVARQVLVQRPYLWAATGTPTPNGPQDAHGQARLVNGAYGESYKSFRIRTMYQLGAFRWVPKRGAEQEALKLLSPAVRFRITDCVDVPLKLPPQLINVELSDAQKKAYAAFRKDAILMVEGGSISAANEAVLRGKLIQISCGAVYEQREKERVVHTYDCGPRVRAMYEAIEQAGGKIIIFAPLTSVLTLLCKELGKMVKVEGVDKPQYKVGLINGQVLPKRRAELLHEFRQTDGLDILLADPGTVSHGVDLSEAKVILWFALPEKTEQYLQANERIRGPNQKFPTQVMHLVATPIEREIYRRLEGNESLQGALLALIRGEHDRYNGRGFGAPPPGFAGVS